MDTFVTYNRMNSEKKYLIWDSLTPKERKKILKKLPYKQANGTEHRKLNEISPKVYREDIIGLLK